MPSKGVLFHQIKLSNAYELNEVAFKGVCLGLNPKRKVLYLPFKVDVLSRCA